MTLTLTSCEDAPLEVRVKELHYDEHGMEATFVGTAVRNLAEGLVEQFHADGGINYVEWNIHRADEGWFVLTLRRRDGKSPATLTAERLAEIERLTTWEPISSAPRNGRWFIICREGEPDFYEVGRFNPLMLDQYVEAGDGLYRKVPEVAYEWDGFNNFHLATHWMYVQKSPGCE